MNYTLHQLQVFIKVVQARSITRASEELHMTQPAVSIQLKNFQDQFDIPLTEVIGRQLYVTEFGKEIHAIAEKIINEVNAINYKTTAFKGLLSGRLMFSVVSTGKYIMPYFLSDFMKEHPSVELQIDVTNKSKVINSLQNNEVDFALVSLLPEDLKIKENVLLDNELYLTGSRENKISSKTLTKNEVQELPLIYREEGSGTRLVMEEYFAKKKINARKKLELTSNETVKQAVIAGLGYSIMPLIGMRNELKNGDIKIISAEGLPIRTKWRLIWLANKQMSPVAQKYLDFLDNHKNKILKNYFPPIKKQK
jgi:LysR family transcriptional regulator, low CO2-responsive transcriptional regulator